MVKIIAFHLPQFHVIPENEAWWGAGHTEWSLTKAAKPMFEGHYQPRIPFNQNYYNMCERETQIWQAQLAREYGIYGFCYYHYWFGGKQLLQRPLEILLENPRADLPFCLCWATESWVKNGKVLIEQTFGDASEWQKHFEYLLPYFSDKRYIKVDNKPAFIMYRTDNFPLVDKMLTLFDDLCKKHGFAGIYAIEQINSFQSKHYSTFAKQYLQFEPMYTLNHNLPFNRKLKNFVKRFARHCLYKLGVSTPPAFLLHREKYDDVWKRIMERDANAEPGRTLFLGAFADWDNTARKKGESVILTGASPEKFQKYLAMQVLRANRIGSEFIFFNAWNEWSEGTYLEPDEKYEYKYLEAVREALKQGEK